MEFTNSKIKESWFGNTNGQNMAASASLGLSLACLQWFFRLCNFVSATCGHRKTGRQTVKSTHTPDTHTPRTLCYQELLCHKYYRWNTGANPKEFLLQLPRLTGFAQTPHQSFHKSGRIRNKDCILHCSPCKHAEIFWVLGSWDVQDGFPLVFQQACQEILCHPLI